MQDVLPREEAAKSKATRQHLQLLLATTDHLDDVMAALSFLKTAPATDAKRIAIVGHSFGGQLHCSPASKTVPFELRSPELRERLRVSVEKTTVPIMLI